MLCLRLARVKRNKKCNILGILETQTSKFALHNFNKCVQRRSFFLLHTLFSYNVIERKLDYIQLQILHMHLFLLIFVCFFAGSTNNLN